MMLLTLAQQTALVEALLARRHVQRWVLIEEVNGLEVDLENLAGHDWEVLFAS
jgi:hypothetical protein